MKGMHSIIIKPLFTEKSLREAAKGKYTFVVDPKADKNEIKNAIEMLYSVSVKNVLTSKARKTQSIVTKVRRSTKPVLIKKARVVLKEGQKLDIFEEGKE